MKNFIECILKITQSQGGAVIIERVNSYFDLGGHIDVK